MISRLSNHVIPGVAGLRWRMHMDHFDGFGTDLQRGENTVGVTQFEHKGESNQFEQRLCSQDGGVVGECVKGVNDKPFLQHIAFEHADALGTGRT